MRATLLFLLLVAFAQMPAADVLTIQTTQQADERGTSGLVVISRSGTTSGALVVDLVITGSATAADYSVTISSTTATLVQQSGFRSLSATFAPSILSLDVKIHPVWDGVRESTENVLFTLRPPSDTSGAELGSSQSASLTILDGTPVVSLEALGSLSEATPSATAALIIRIEAAIPEDLVVAVTQNGTAQPGLDYVNPGLNPVVIPMGSTLVTVPLNVLDDAEFEAPESASFAVTSTSKYIAGTNAVVGIDVIDDEPTVSITISGSATISEVAGSTALSLVRTGSTSAALTVAITVGGTSNAADRIPSSAALTLVIPVGATVASLVVTGIDDALREIPESVVVTVGASVTYRLAPGATTAIVTLTDDEGDVSIEKLKDANEDGNVGGFRISRTGTGATTTNVNVSISPTGSAITGEDYVAFGATVAIPAGATFADLVVQPINDAVYDPGETLQVQIVPKDAYGQGATTSATIQIRDDKPEVEISPRWTHVAEGPGATAAFRVARLGPTAAALVVPIKLISIGATAATAADLRMVPVSATIAVGATFADIVLDVVDDRIIEGDETLTLGLRSAPTRYTIQTSAATASLRIDDVLPTVFISQVSSGYEGATISFVVNLAATRAEPVIVSWSLAGTVDPVADLSVSATGSVVFPIGSSRVEIVFQALDDGKDELTETADFILQPTEGSYQIVPSASRATASVFDTTPTVQVFKVRDGSEPDLPVIFRIAYGGTAIGRPATVAITASGAFVNPATRAVIAAGATFADIAFYPRDDLKIEAPESVMVTIATVDRSAFASGTAGAVVYDDDPALFAIANEPNVVVVAAGDKWSHQVVFAVTNRIIATGVRAQLVRPPGGTAPPGWVIVDDPEFFTDGTVGIKLHGTVAGSVPVRIRLRLESDFGDDGSVESSALLDLVLVVVSAPTEGG